MSFNISFNIKEREREREKERERERDDVFRMFGVPKSITHDGGPPYNSEDWRSDAKEQGFESRLCTPENPEVNASTE